jgi:hypothetical protein
MTTAGSVKAAAALSPRVAGIRSQMYRGCVAIRLEVESDLSDVVERTRQQLHEAGEDRAAVAGVYDPGLAPAASDAILGLLRDGTYHRAAARIAAVDPDLADQ